MFKKIKQWYVTYRKQLADEKEIKRNKILEEIHRPWTDEEVRYANIQLATNSAGWIGGNYSENDLKKTILMNNYNLFTHEEYLKEYDILIKKST